jgi:hypothetical protein
MVPGIQARSAPPMTGTPSRLPGGRNAALLCATSLPSLNGDYSYPSPHLGTLTRETAAWNKTANVRKLKIQWRFTKTKARKHLGYTPPT